MSIQVSPEELETSANRIDQWAEQLKQQVRDSAQKEANNVDSIPNFSGKARDNYVAKFREMSTEIQNAIERISDETIRPMRENLQKIGRSFQDMDQSFNF